MAQKLSLKFNKSRFADLISKLKDLTGIEDVIKIKFDKDNMVLYSVLQNEQQVSAMKTYVVKTGDYLQGFDGDDTIDFVITSAPKFVKNIQFFILTAQRYSFINTNKEIKSNAVW